MFKNTINAIKNLFIEYKKRILHVAYALMPNAKKKAQNELFIKAELLQYESLNATQKLQKLVDIGEIAIIPIGFRCFTSGLINKKLGVSQTSMPFNSGFFSPHSIVQVFSNPEFKLEYQDKGTTHRVCMKIENHLDPTHGKGIKFQLSSYDEINSIVTEKNIEGINKFLDSTLGYYTLDLSHKVIFAHYNWHKFANYSHSKGIIDPNKNLQILNDTMNRRITRMLETCDEAKHIFFISGETQGYNYIQIDKSFYFLNDFHELNKILTTKYGTKFSIININNIVGPEDLINLYRGQKK